MFSKDGAESGLFAVSVLALIAVAIPYELIENGLSAVAATSAESAEATTVGIDWRTYGLLAALMTITTVGVMASGMTRTQNSQIA
jgi:hypothetical protein